MSESKTTKFAWLVAVGVFGCGDGDGSRGALPWDHEGTQVVGPDRGVAVVDTPAGDSCFVWGQEFVEASDCAKPQEQCDGGPFDVLVGDGKVLDTLCYPKGEPMSVVEVEAKDGVIAQNENNTVIVLPDDASVALEADVTLDANKVVLYGHGPDVSVLSGDLTVDGNNAIIRGIRITGDATVKLNSATFFFCAIEGNVVIEANNTTIAGCDIFGNVSIRGNNTRFVGNHVVGSFDDRGGNTVCEDNFVAQDANEDFVLEAGEIGDALSC